MPGVLLIASITSSVWKAVASSAARAMWPRVGESRQAADQRRAPAHSNAARTGRRKPARRRRRRCPARCAPASSMSALFGSARDCRAAIARARRRSRSSLRAHRRASPRRTVSQRGEQPVLGRDGRLAGVHQHEAAGAVGVLRLARLEACLTEQRRLLIAENAGDGHARESRRRRRHTSRSTRRSRAGTQRGISNSLEQSPSSHCSVRISISCVRLAFVTSVMCTRRAAAGQVPDEPGVDGAEQRRRRFALRARARHVVEQPAQLQPARNRSSAAGRSCREGGPGRRRAHIRRRSHRRACPARRARCGAAARSAGPRAASSRADW